VYWTSKCISSSACKVQSKGMIEEKLSTKYFTGVLWSLMSWESFAIWVAEVILQKLFMLVQACTSQKKSEKCDKLQAQPARSNFSQVWSRFPFPHNHSLKILYEPFWTSALVPRMCLHHHIVVYLSVLLSPLSTVMAVVFHFQPFIKLIFWKLLSYSMSA
jgi:hypothetical protein